MELHLKRNRTKNLSIIFFIILLILLFLSWLYIFNIYEVVVSVSRISSLNYAVKIEPKNSFGFTAPFRKILYSFEVFEGTENIESITDESNGRIIVKLKSDSTKVKMQIKTDKTQNISLVEIPNHNMEQL